MQVEYGSQLKLSLYFIEIPFLNLNRVVHAVVALQGLWYLFGGRTVAGCNKSVMSAVREQTDDLIRQTGT